VCLTFQKIFGSAQVIDSKFAYMFNLRSNPAGNKLYFRADKSDPNIYSLTSTGPNANQFTMSDISPLKSSVFAFFAFDVYTYNNIDYMIGAGVGIDVDTPRMSLPLIIAGTNQLNSPYQQYHDLVLYTAVIDRSSFVGGSGSVFYVGWNFGNFGSSTGLVVARATATLTAPMSIIVNQQTDMLVINSKDCYDIWNDVNKPHMWIDDIEGFHTLVIVVSGRCDGIYKIQINKPDFSRSTFKVFQESHTINKDIFSSAYNPKTHKLYYSYKEYNAADISIFSYDMLNFLPEPSWRQLNSNETIPVLAVDSEKNILYIATTDSDKIYKVDGADIKKNLGIATLPAPLKQVSSMLVNGDYLYMVTWEANAQAGRISTTKSFCTEICGTNGYCVSTPAPQCFCSPGFSRDPATPFFNCITSHEHDIYQTVLVDRSLSITLGILFGLALVAAIAGWFLWWKSYKTRYSTM